MKQLIAGLAMSLLAMPVLAVDATNKINPCYEVYDMAVNAGMTQDRQYQKFLYAQMMEPFTPEQAERFETVVRAYGDQPEYAQLRNTRTMSGKFIESALAFAACMQVMQ